jgi:CRP/FNR family transcriptional regulator, cyclic AMP receptor protein
MKLGNIFEKDTTPVSYPAGTVIFNEGQARDVMYVVKTGQIDILVCGQIAETVCPDGFFGELALIDKSPRSATAVAKTDCSLIPITEKQFLFLVQETPFFALTVMATLARRIRSRNAQFGVMPVSAKADAGG